MKKIALCGLSAMLILFCVSCGSKPAPEPEKTPEPPKVEEPKIEEPEPEKIEEVVEEEVKKVDNTLVLKNTEEARQNAMDSGAGDYALDQLIALDDLYDAMKARSDNGEDISAEADELSKKYAALAAYAKAVEAKETIDDTELFTLAQSVYDEGCKALADYEVLAADPSSKGADQLDKATKASASFNSVLVVVYKQIAKDERTDAFVAKKNADSVKAGVAQKEKYNEGVEYFKKGDSLYSMQSFEKAYDNYESSKTIFEELYNDIAEKRAAVQKAIEDAKKKVNETAEFAEQADQESPLKEKVEGIEDEDAVLLEEDDYDDPADAEADLPEEIEDPTKKLIKSLLTGDEK